MNWYLQKPRNYSDGIIQKMELFTNHGIIQKSWNYSQTSVARYS